MNYKFYQYSRKRMRRLNRIDQNFNIYIMQGGFSVAKMVSSVCSSERTEKCIPVKYCTRKSWCPCCFRGFIKTDFKLSTGLLQNIQELFTSLSNRGTFSEYSWVTCRKHWHLTYHWSAVQDRMKRLIANISLNVIYQDTQLPGLNSAARPFTESEKENLTTYRVRYVEEQFLDQGFTERSTATCNTCD